MKLANIIPGRLDLMYQTSYQMALGQQLQADTWYLQCFRKLRRRGDFIIVDNGAAEPEEERIPFEDIISVANAIRADEIALPDVLRDSDATVWHTARAAPAVPYRNRMIIPQGQDLTEWTQCLWDLYNALDGRFATIGVPKLTEAWDGGRVSLLSRIVQHGFHERYNVHLLGVYAGAWEEISSIASLYPWVRGIDTGLAVAVAQNDEVLDRASNRYSLVWGEGYDEDLAFYNVFILRRWCRHGL
jgi:hypothetical protein